MHPRVGDTISHYRLVDRIGEGGSGAVYRARDTLLDRDVALKFIVHRGLGSKEGREALLREARAAAALDHPNVCAVYEVGEAEGLTFIVMALVEGQSLSGLLASRRLEVREAVELALQIATGLRAAHAKNVVHRDVKAGNVMVTQEGQAKILDFGLARVVDPSDHTDPDDVGGTLAYMPPERLEGHGTDHRSDIWSLGVLLHQMLTGTVPFTGKTAAAVMFKVLHRNPEPVTALRPNVPLALEHVLNKALAKRPQDRYQRADAMGADLETILEGGFVAAPAAESDSSADGAAQWTARQYGLDNVTDDGPVRILVVDDEPDLELLVRQHFRKQLRSGRLDFAFAADGVEALEQLEQDPSLELVLTDIRMPRMDGLTLLGELSGLDRLLKAVVVSAYGDLGNVRMAMNRGAFDFITKPIDFQDLETTIGKTIREISHYREAAEARRRLSSMEQELDVARRIQEAAHPRALPKTSGVDVHAFVSPAREVGGDFHDFFYLEDGTLAILVGEVFGSGVAAAMSAAVARSLVKATALTGLPPSLCMTRVNGLIAAEGLRAMSVNAFYGVLDPASGRLTYARAGHTQPYLVPARGGVRRLEGAPQVSLGAEPDTRYHEDTVVLETGDTVFLYTDGVTAALAGEGLPAPIERLEAALGKSRGQTSAQLVRDVLREFTDPADGAPGSDDVTALSVRYVGLEGS